MNLLPNNFNDNFADNKLPDSPDLMASFTFYEKEAAKKKLRRLFLILLIIGLSLGVVVSVGVVQVLNKLGLTEKTNDSGKTFIEPIRPQKYK